jgi:site-specific DNA recombinase
MSKSTVQIATAKKVVRCAIYTRKSTEEGLQQEFNTLDAQRESAQACIAAQKHEGWVCLPDRYDDGGFTGGNLERPAMKRLLADIEAGKVDCVVVYKVDRLSRSLMDFSRVMQTFDQHHVSFVSVTQHFNTTHSMGRLTLNILLSFAQFEREIISERTRDKIAAARRKGKFAGGKPVLGYDLLSNPAGPKLVVNGDEATQVRAIFAMYLKHQALIPVAKELDALGWATKRWVSKSDKAQGGRPFTKNLLYHLLTNVVYAGKVRYHEEVHPGEHPAIVEEGVWQAVQAVLGRNGRTGGAPVKNKHGALLKGILWCVPCQCSMGHTYTADKTKRYRYYVCLNAQKRGWHTCASKSVPAGEIERFVVEQIKSIGKDPHVVARTVGRARSQGLSSLAELQAQQRILQKELARHHADLRKCAAAANKAGEMAIAQEGIRTAERRATEIGERIIAVGRETVDEREVQAALSVFDPVWDTLSPKEQTRILQLLVERVDYDGKEGTIAVTFRPNGIKTLAQQLEEAA